MSTAVKYGKGMPYKWYNISYGKDGYNEDVYTTGIPHIIVGHRSAPIITIKLYDDREMDDNLYKKMFDITEDIKDVCENISKKLHDYNVCHYLYVECLSICDNYGNKQFMGVSYTIHTDGTIYLKHSEASGNMSLEEIIEMYVPRLLKDNDNNIEIDSKSYQERKYTSHPQTWIADTFISLPEGYGDRRELEALPDISEIEMYILSGKMIAMKDETRNIIWTIRLSGNTIIETTVSNGKSVSRPIPKKKDNIEYMTNKIEKMKRKGYKLL